MKLKAVEMSVLKLSFRAKRLAAVSLRDLKTQGKKKLKHMEKDKDGCSLDRGTWERSGDVCAGEINLWPVKRGQTLTLS